MLGQRGIHLFLGGSLAREMRGCDARSPAVGASAVSAASAEPDSALRPPDFCTKVYERISAVPELLCLYIPWIAEITKESRKP